MTLKTGDLSGWSVFVTGANGFVASYCIPALQEAGATVLGLDRSHPSKKFPGVAYFQGEVEETMPSALKSVNPSHRLGFLHLAGMNHIGQCKENPERAFAQNVGVAEKCFLFAQANSFARFLFSSSGVVLGTKGNAPVSEEAAYFPESIYAETKMEAEKKLLSLAQAGKTQCIIGRLANLYGLGAHPDTLVEKIMQKAKEKESVELQGSAHVRDFLSVRDAASAFTLLFSAPLAAKAEIFHISSGRTLTVESIAKIMTNLIDLPQPKQASASTPSGSFLVLKNEKLRALGWHPSLTMEEGLKILAKEKGLL